MYGDIDLSKCCLFHLSKNAFANIQTKGLLLAYSNEDAKMYFRSLVSLAFLPLSEVPDGFDELSLKLNSLLIFEQLSLVDNLARKLIYVFRKFMQFLTFLEYLEYFEKTYIRCRTGRVLREGVFPTALWNHREAAINGMPRTNNAIEGWHNSFNQRFPKSKMPLSQFIVRLQSEEEKTRQILLR